MRTFIIVLITFVMWLVGCKLFAFLARWAFDANPDNEPAAIVGFLISVILALVFLFTQIDDSQNKYL